MAGGLGLLGALLPTRPLARWLLLACGFFAWGRWTAGEAWVAPPQEARRYVGPARVAAAEELRDGRQRLEVDLLPFGVALMMAGSNDFATPIGYQTNLMVYGPGGYRFLDYIRFGGPLNLLMMVVSMLLIPIFWPF